MLSRVTALCLLVVVMSGCSQDAAADIGTGYIKEYRGTVIQDGPRKPRSPRLPSQVVSREKSPTRISRPVQRAIVLRRVTSPAPAVGTGSVNGYPCGGGLPPCWVLRRESGGNPRAVNRTGCGGRTCGGLWQFDPRTWGGYGGYQFAQHAPVNVQNAKARSLWAGGRGCSHWAAC